MQLDPKELRIENHSKNIIVDSMSQLLNDSTKATFDLWILIINYLQSLCGDIDISTITFFHIDICPEYEDVVEMVKSIVPLNDISQASTLADY